MSLDRHPQKHRSKHKCFTKPHSPPAQEASMAQQTARTRISANQCVEKSRGRWNRETHVRHRDYSPTLGRFIERDPIGFDAADNNWYRFVANGPIGKTDPSGLCEPGETEIVIRNAEITSLIGMWKLSDGKQLPSPLAPGVPGPQAFGEAFAKMFLKYVGQLISANGIGRALWGATGTIQLAPKLFINEITIHGQIQATILEKRCVPTLKRCWHLMWCEETGKTHWEESEKTIVLNVRLASVDLTRVPGNNGHGILPIDRNHLALAFNMLHAQLQKLTQPGLMGLVTNAVQSQFPKATVRQP